MSIYRPRKEDGESGRRERALEGVGGRWWAEDLLYLGLWSPGEVEEEVGEGEGSASTGRR